MVVKKFTMDSVLRFRKQQEDILTQKYLKVQQQEAETRNSLECLSNDHSLLITALRSKQEDGITVSDLARFEERITYLKQQKEFVHNELIRRQKAVEKARKRLLAKSMEHKALKTLKEKQNKAWKAHLDKREAIMLDEIAVLRHGRIRGKDS